MDGWQMQCCGTPFSVGSRVAWVAAQPDQDYLASVLGDEVAARVSLAEEHHDDPPDSLLAEGVVRSIQAVRCRYAPDGCGPQPTWYPVNGSATFTRLTTAAGQDGDDGALQFVGYLIELEGL